MESARKVSAMDMVRQAKDQIDNLTPKQVQEEISDPNVVLVDIREKEELDKKSKIRGMLEFCADSSLPYPKREFDEKKRIILHCASGERSALAAKPLKEMGYENVAHLDGGLKAWKESGLPVA